ERRGAQTGKPTAILGGDGRVCAVRLPEFQPDPQHGSGNEHGFSVFDAEPSPTAQGRQRLQGGCDVRAEYEDRVTHPGRGNRAILHPRIRGTRGHAPYAIPDSATTLRLREFPEGYECHGAGGTRVPRRGREGQEPAQRSDADPELIRQAKPQYQSTAPRSQQQQEPAQPRLNRHQESDERVQAAHYSPLAARGGYSRARTSPLEAMVHALNPRDVNLGAIWEE